MPNQNLSQFESLKALLLYANVLRREGSYEAAISVYEHVAERFGESSQLCFVIANCYFHLALSPTETGQNFDAAITSMQKAIRLAPDDARLHAVLAQYYELGSLEYETAAEEYRRAIALAPADPWILTNAASLYGVPENVVTWDEAVSWLTRAIQVEPNDPNCYGRLGQLYHEKGLVEDAKREWFRALLCARPLDPGYAEMIRLQLGE